MKKLSLSINLLFFVQVIVCRDFYFGMFRKNDFLVAQDVIFKDASPFGYATASYGRVFKCPITYFRVVDRLGMGRGPFTTIVRGGLKKNFIVARIRSTYNIPVSVNIYVGCEYKASPTTTLVTTSDTENDGNSAGPTESNGNSTGTTESTGATGTTETTIATETNAPAPAPEE